MSEKAFVAGTADGAGGSLRRAHWALAALLVAYTAVTIAYGLVNPLFEAPDEHWHYFTTQFIAEQKSLPLVAPGEQYDEWLSQEAAQPPLSYLLGSLLIAPIDTSAARDKVWPNKFADIGDAGALINLNRFVHTEQESWPWQGYALAAHLLRLSSTLLGLGTLLFIYGGGRLLWPDDPFRAVLALGLVAFLPQFNFLHAAISNDPLIIFLVTAALWQLMRVWQTGTSSRRLLLLGVTIGMAILTKNAGIILLIFAGGVLALLAWRDWLWDPAGEAQGWRKLASGMLLLLGPALLLGGWLWLRNLSLYGDPTATNQFIRFAGGDRGYTLPQVLRESGGLWLSLFAVFGWFNLRAPQWIYWFWNGVILLAAGGALWAFWAGRARRTPAEVNGDDASGFMRQVSLLLQRPWVLPALLAVWVFAVYASLVIFMLQTEAAQGRLLFPALLPLALGAAFGLSAPPLLRRFAPLILIAALGITIYCLFYVIQPAYEKPTLLLELPAEATPLDVQMGQGVRLVGALLESKDVLPGEPLWLTLYWQGRDVSPETPQHVLSVFGRKGTEIGKVHSYHGRGLFPANLWPEGLIVADRFGLWLSEDAVAPVLARIDTGLLRGDGATQVGTVKISPAAWPSAAEPLQGMVGTAVGFAAVEVSPQQARAGVPVTVSLKWQAVEKPQTDLTALVHMGQPDQPPLATGDQPPLAGEYPTSAWEQGEVIDDVFRLAIPPGTPAGRYPIWIGMYDTRTLARLPITIEGEGQPFDVYLAGWVEVLE